MSDVDWDAEEFVPPVVTAPRAVTDKWDGEDEEDEVKESWEDDEKKDDSSQTIVIVKKKKKKLGEILAEKEKRKLEELERRQKEKEEEKRNKTPDDVSAEKLRIQKIQEDSDLEIAINLLGGEKSEPSSLDNSLDAFDISTSSGLDGFKLALLKKIRSTDRLEKKPFYLTFLEDFCRDLCENLETDDIKRVTTILNSLYNEKVKASKPTKGRKKPTKAKINPGQGAIADDVGNFDDYNDFI